MGPGKRDDDDMSEAFEKWWKTEEAQGETMKDVARRAWEKSEATIVGRLDGEWGEMEVGPTRTIDDAVEHIHGVGRVIMRFINTEMDWRDWANKVAGTCLYKDDDLRKAVEAKLRPAPGGGPK